MYDKILINNEVNNLKSFLNLSNPYYEDIALIVMAFKDKIAKNYDIDMNEIYSKLSKLKTINEIDNNPDFLGLFNPNIDNGEVYEISIVKDAKDDEFLRRYILTHELVHLFSSKINADKFIINNNLDYYKNINEILTEKFTSLIMKELYLDYDSKIDTITFYDELKKQNIKTKPVGLGYQNISEISNILFNIYEGELVNDFFKGSSDFVISNKISFEILDKSLGSLLKEVNISNSLQINKPILDLFKEKVFNEDMTSEFLINYLRKSQEVIDNSYLIGKHDYSYLKESFETIDTMIYCKFFNKSLNPFFETNDSHRSFEVENFVTVMSFLRENQEILNKMEDISNIDYKCIYDDKNKRILSLQFKTDEVEEYYDIKLMKNNSNKINSIKLNISSEIYESQNEISYEYKTKSQTLDFEKMIAENNRKNHAFIQKHQDNKNLNYVYTFLDEALDMEYQKIIKNSNIFDNLKDNKGRNMSYLLTSSNEFNMDIVIRFLKQKTKLNDLINEVDVYGKTTVDYLIEKGDINRLNIILRRLDLDNNFNLLKNEDLLMKSAIFGKNDILAYLNKNEIGLDMKDDKGNNLFFIALENIESMNAVSLVRNNNYQNFVSREGIDYKNNSGDNLLNFYCKKDNINPLALKKILTKYELDIDSKDNNGNTSLMNLVLNCKENSFENSLISIHHLLSKGANPEIENKDGCTSLQLAVFSLYTGRESHEKDYKIIETLVKGGADINKENMYYSPFDCACKTKNIEILKAFVRGGTNVNEIISKPIFKENFVSSIRREVRTELRKAANETHDNELIRENKNEEPDLSL